MCELDDIGSGGAGGAVGRLDMSNIADSSRPVVAGGAGSSTIFCPSGWVSTGGGYTKGLPGNVYVNAPASNSAGTGGWMAAVDNPGVDATSIKAFTRCARVVP